MRHVDVRKYFSNLRKVKKQDDLDKVWVKAASIHSYKSWYNRVHVDRRTNESGKWTGRSRS